MCCLDKNAVHCHRLTTIYFENFDPKHDPRLQNTRLSSAEWSVLEDILRNWQLVMESRSLSTSREVFQNKARWIWLNVLEAQNSIENTDGQDRTANIRNTICYHELDDVYNFDQTGLYWRRLASSGLSSGSRPGAKLNNSRISVGVCCNATGSDIFQLWFVGNANQLNALKNFNWGGYRRYGNSTRRPGSRQLSWWIGFTYSMPILTEINRRETSYFSWITSQHTIVG
ncbi:hypothetical protein K3495_g3362 [Podosphaera aphanis]|nr:hypothetical protein K3495_g3362 [Podosphaera aphanis]